MLHRILSLYPFGNLARATAGIALLATLATMPASGAGVITNDTFWQDTSGNNIYSQGGGVFKFGDTYYWYGVRYAGAVAYAANPNDGKIEDTTFQAVTCYSSTDLVNWTHENDILTSSTSGLGSVSWLGRIGVFFNASTSQYVLVTQYFGSLPGSGGNLYCTSSTPTGNFAVNTVQYPVPGVANDRTGDQTVFIDTDGTPYLICSSAEGRSNWYVARFNSNGIGTQTAVRIGGGPGREGNCMFKYNGVYYFCGSDLYGWNASRCYYMTATNIFGPYSSENVMVNSALDFCHVTQTGFFITVPGTETTTVIFAGDRWAAFAGNGIGYNQWNPVTFNGTTPIFNSMSRWNFDVVTGNWSVAEGNNYVLNPSYEADRVEQSWASGWSTTSNSGNNGGDGDGRTGDFFFEHWASGSYSATTEQTISVPNGTYTLSVWFRSSGGQSTCRMFARNYGGSQVNSNLNTAQSSWAQRTISGINVTNGQIEVGVESTASGGQWVNFEDWELTSEGGCTPTPITPYLQINDGAWQEATTASLSVGDSVRFGPQPVSGGSWSWSGPNGFSASTREVLISNIQSNQAGTYTATHTNSGGCQSTQPFTVTVGGGGTGDTYQAESAVLGGGAVIESNHTGFNGTGFVNFPSNGGTATFNNVDGNGGGSKTITIRYALGATGSRTGTITVNGSSSNITFNPTGAWNSWATMNVNITLNNNTSNTITLQSTGQDLANIDEIFVPGGTAPTPDTYQAESGVAAGGVSFDSNNSGFNGTGFANFPSNGGTLTFNSVDGNGGGTKSLEIRYALGASGSRTGTITVNGSSSNITFNTTGAWNSWTTMNVNITLNNNSSNTIQFASTGQDLANIDEITVP